MKTLKYYLKATGWDISYSIEKIAKLVYKEMEKDKTTIWEVVVRETGGAIKTAGVEYIADYGWGYVDKKTSPTEYKATCVKAIALATASIMWA